MTAVQVMGIKVLDNPCQFLDPFRFEITFEATQKLEEDLEWRLTYVGSADSEIHDQVLDSVLVGPVPLGVNRFVFEAPAADPARIPAGDLLGVTVVLLECLYKDRVFVRVGYYVSNENPDDIAAAEAAAAALAAQGGNADKKIEDSDAMDVEDLKSDEEEEGEEEEEMLMEEDKAGETKENVSTMAADQQLVKKPIVEIHPSKIRRFILEDKPRVTRFPIEWDSVVMPGGGAAPAGGFSTDSQQGLSASAM